MYIWGTCSGSVLALRLGTEITVLGTPSPIAAATRCYSLVKNSTPKKVRKRTLNKPKGSPSEARKVSRIITKPIVSQMCYVFFTR